MKFLELEGGYLVIAAFIIIVTLYVTTRPFLPKGSYKIGLPSVMIVLLVAISLHFIITTDRMETVKTAFSNGQNILCESRAVRKVAQSLIINKKQGWELEVDVFKSKEYERVFHTSRCIVE
jgi:hypothetical protein